MSIRPDRHDPDMVNPGATPDNLVAGNLSEEDPVDHPVEPPSWLSDGKSPVATEMDGGAQSDPAAPAPVAPRPAAEPAKEAAAEETSFTPAPSFGQDNPYRAEGGFGQSPLSQDGGGSWAPASSPYSYGQDPYSVGPVPATDDALAPPHGEALASPYAAPRTSYQPPAGETTAFRAPPAQPAAAPMAAVQRRRANLVVARLEPWSVMKFSFLMSLVAWVVLFVAVALLYFALSALGVFDSLQSTLSGVTSSQGTAGFNLGNYISASKVLGYTMLIGAANIFLITALSTVGAMIYNLVTHLGGGIEVTLRESD